MFLKITEELFIHNTHMLSPCKKICKLSNEKDYCIACFRTIYEIKNWKKYSSLEKKKIIKDLNSRK